MDKNYFFSIIILSCILTASCTDNKTNKQTTDDNNQKSISTEQKSKPIKKSLVVTSDFTNIINVGSIDIVYKEGDYNIEVEGDSALLEFLRYDIDSKLLTVRLEGESNKDLSVYIKKSTGITMYVSTPELKAISLCNSGSFKSTNTIHTDDFQVGAMGNSTFDVDSIVCKSFRYEHNDNGTSTFKMIDCESADIFTNCTGEVTANINASNSATLTMRSSCNINMKCKSPDIQVISFPNCTSNATLDLDTKSLQVAANGKGTITLSGNYYLTKTIGDGKIVQK